MEIVAPQEPIVETGAEELSEILQACIQGVNPRVVLAMKEVGYLDSLALEGLVDAADQLAARSLQLKMAAVTPTCREIFELTGLSGRFQLFDNIEDAIRSYR